jgi:hypothetical protein
MLPLPLTSGYLNSSQAPQAANILTPNPTHPQKSKLKNANALRRPPQRAPKKSSYRKTAPVTK